jgi:hypothetical protein
MPRRNRPKRETPREAALRGFSVLVLEQGDELPLLGGRRERDGRRGSPTR